MPFLLVSKTTNVVIEQVFSPSTWQTSLMQENRMVIRMSRRSASGWAILSMLAETTLSPFLSSSSSWQIKWHMQLLNTQITETAITEKMKLNLSFSNMLKFHLFFQHSSISLYSISKFLHTKPSIMNFLTSFIAQLLVF